MSDITMCRNSDCPLKSVCERAIANPNPIMQAFDNFKPFRNQDDGTWDCEMYLKPKYVKQMMKKRYE